MICLFLNHFLIPYVDSSWIVSHRLLFLSYFQRQLIYQSLKVPFATMFHGTSKFPWCELHLTSLWRTWPHGDNFMNRRSCMHAYEGLQVFLKTATNNKLIGKDPVCCSSLPMWLVGTGSLDKDDTENITKYPQRSEEPALKSLSSERVWIVFHRTLVCDSPVHVSGQEEGQKSVN